jgi:crossover junction endodeoxyribonuclease RuvC
VGRLRVLGIDPGTRIAGWAVVEADEQGAVQRLDSGSLRLGSRLSVIERLLELRHAVEGLLRDWSPDLLAVEAAFFGRNARSALRLGEARGVVLVGAAAAGVAVAELPPALVKRRVGGSGVISKEGLAALVAAQLGLEPCFDSPDESDALAVALCAILENAVPAQETRPSRRGLPPGAALQ